MVGVDGPQPPAVVAHHVTGAKGVRRILEPEDVQRPHPGVGRVADRGPRRAGHVGDERRTDGPSPAHRLGQHLVQPDADVGVEAFEGVDRPEHLGQRAARGVQAERGVLTVAHHPVDAGGQAVTIDLEPVSQARPDDGAAAYHLVQQAGGVELVVTRHLTDVGGDHRSQEQPAEARQRVDRQDQVPERQAAGGRGGLGVPDLQLGQQHRGRRYT